MHSRIIYSKKVVIKGHVALLVVMEHALKKRETLNFGAIFMCFL